MKRKILSKRVLFITLAIFLLSSTLLGCRQKEETLPPEGEFAEIATEFVEELTEEEFESAAGKFNEEMRRAMPKELLGQTWKQLEDQVGPFIQIIILREEIVQEYDVIFVTTEFENEFIDIRVVFDKEKWIAGLFFEPASEYSVERGDPDYVDREAFREEEVTFGEEPWMISGTLTIPEGEGPHPVVILVHGSGPNDRDSTIGPNRPFKDIAEGLSSSGVAVLRYDKRTYTYQTSFIDTPGEITVREETTEDALKAITFLKAREEIDGEQIFLAGHSLGGMLAPRIAEETEDLKRLILLAAPGRPLSELILMQTEYLIEHEEQHTEDLEVGMEELRRQVERIQDPNLPLDTPLDETLGVPAAYWLDLQQYNALETAKALTLPIMILQGERDYQVTTEDLELWRQTLENEPEVSFHSYADLNHLFMPGEGLSLPDEYFEANHVDELVIMDILNWIRTD